MDLPKSSEMKRAPAKRSLAGVVWDLFDWLVVAVLIIGFWLGWILREVWRC